MIDAVVLAGGIPSEGEPLYPLTRGKSKALLPVAGKPMAQWVLDALAASKQVRRVVVVGLDGGLRYPRELVYVPNHGGMLDNLHAGAEKILELDPGASHLLVISSDIPTATGAQIDWVIEQTLNANDDFSYCVIERRTMEGLFPGSRRTYFRFRDKEVCGGDLVVIGTRLFSMDAGIWQRLTAARKNRLRTVAIIGLDVLILFLLRRLTIDEAVQRASRRLNVRGRAVHCPHPEVGMDVDKPFQLDIVEDFMRRRAAG
jgi:molybdopterin-guanine dinucleotide biosynthesis protein A